MARRIRLEANRKVGHGELVRGAMLVWLLVLHAGCGDGRPALAPTTQKTTEPPPVASLPVAPAPARLRVTLTPSGARVSVDLTNSFRKIWRFLDEGKSVTVITRMYLYRSDTESPVAHLVTGCRLYRTGPYYLVRDMDSSGLPQLTLSEMELRCLQPHDTKLPSAIATDASYYVKVVAEIDWQFASVDLWKKSPAARATALSMHKTLLPGATSDVLVSAPALLGG